MHRGFLIIGNYTFIFPVIPTRGRPHVSVQRFSYFHANFPNTGRTLAFRGTRTEGVQRGIRQRVEEAMEGGGDARWRVAGIVERFTEVR